MRFTFLDKAIKDIMDKRGICVKLPQELTDRVNFAENILHEKPCCDSRGNWGLELSEATEEYVIRRGATDSVRE